ncbi:MAG: PKD domain-containing protein [Flavipsychrobacter sp.]|nr:PKD domain-containing protein [Flavipsychrobacter sp.]
MTKKYSLALCAILFPLLVQAHPHSGNGIEYIKNLGQWDGDFIYKSNTAQGDIYLQQRGFTYVIGRADNAAKIEAVAHGRIKEQTTLYYHAYRVSFTGANNASVSGSEEQEVYYNYYLGNDPKRWKSGIHPVQVVDYKNLYDGIDMHIASEDGSMKYEFVVAPGANPYIINMAYEGTDRLSVKDENLVVTTSLGEAIEKKPYAYQVIKGQRREVPCLYKVKGRSVSYYFPDGYNEALPLVIDPVVVFASFTGSQADNFGFTATYDDLGNFYAGGLVSGQGFPVSTGAFQATFGGGGVGGTGYACDMGIIKLSANGQNRIYGTYIGGLDNETPHSMVVDANNNLIIAGRTYSNNFPVTPGCYDNTHNGGGDIAVTKLNFDGTALLASTYIGGPGDDGVNFNAIPMTLGGLKYNYGDDARSEIIVDNAGDIYVAASTRTAGFPTVNAIQNTLQGPQDAVVFKFNPNLNNLMWSTYLGGNSEDAAYVLALDPSQANIYVAGGTQGNGFPFSSGTLWGTYQGGPADGFIAKFQNSGTYPLVRATAIGTSNYDQCYGIQTDLAGNVYAMGQSLGGLFPVNNVVYSNPGSCQFVIKLDNNLNTNLYSTVFGSGNSSVTNISPVAFLVDTCENVYVSGWGGRLDVNFPASIGYCTGMPITTDAAQSTTDGSDFYFIVFPKNITSLLYGTFMGQNNPNGEHVDGGTSRFDRNGVVYQAICGGCGGTSFPTTPGVWSTNNQSANCNLVALKIQFDFLPVICEIDLQGDSTGCAPFTVNLTNNSSNAVNYVWDFGDGSPIFTGTTPPPHVYTSAGTYTIMLAGENANACNQTVDTDYVTIVVDSGGITADFSFIKTDTCDPFIATFTNTSTYSGNQGDTAITVFVWDFGDGSPTYTGTTPPPHTFPGVGTYTVTLTMTDTSACNPQDIAQQTITFSFTPVVAGTLGDTVCLSAGMVTLPNLSQNATVHSWFFSNGTTTNVETPTFQFDSAGLYTAYVISGNPNNCNQYDTSQVVNILVVPVPDAAFDYTPNPHVRNQPVTFINNSTGVTSQTQYSWTFGDGTGSNLKDPVPHMYPKKGNYEICLTVTNPVDGQAGGCIDLVCKTIFVDIKPIIDIPTAFSPNGDGRNDILYVRGAAIASLNLKVFNRWGELVFETSTIEMDPNDGSMRSAGWDGKVRGKEQDMDSYAYVLTATFLDGNKYEDQGNVTLIR